MSDDLAPARWIRLVTMHGVFHAVTDDLITRQLIEFGAHTRNELAMVLAHIGEGDVFVDVGAHIGTFVIPVARVLGSRGKCLAIEGGAETHALLERNVGANGLVHKIQTCRAVVGQTRQGNLRRVDVDGNTGAGYYAPHPVSDVEVVDACAVIRSLGFARPDFLKIDIEGMEPFVLRSIAPVLAARRPKLYVEIVADQLARLGESVADLDAFLRSFGYRFFRNAGERNSTNDRYIKTELSSLSEGGQFFDLLALPE